MARLLYLIRHGAIHADYNGRFIGSTDVPLSKTGRQQIAELAKYIQTLTIHRHLVSPLKRTVETAYGLFPTVAWQTDNELREVDFGDWEGMSFQEIATADPDRVQCWHDFDPAFRFPNGEALGNFHSRLRRLAERLSGMPEDAVCMVTHGGVIRSLICYFLGMSFQQYLLFRVELASVTSIELFSDGGVLNGLSWTPDHHCYNKEGLA